MRPPTAADAAKERARVRDLRAVKCGAAVSSKRAAKALGVKTCEAGVARTMNQLRRNVGYKRKKKTA